MPRSTPIFSQFGTGCCVAALTLGLDLGGESDLDGRAETAGSFSVQRGFFFGLFCRRSAPFRRGYDRKGFRPRPAATSLASGEEVRATSAVGESEGSDPLVREAFFGRSLALRFLKKKRAGIPKQDRHHPYKAS